MIWLQLPSACQRRTVLSSLAEAIVPLGPPAALHQEVMKTVFAVPRNIVARATTDHDWKTAFQRKDPDRPVQQAAQAATTSERPRAAPVNKRRVAQEGGNALAAKCPNFQRLIMRGRHDSETCQNSQSPKRRATSGVSQQRSERKMLRLHAMLQIL